MQFSSFICSSPLWRLPPPAFVASSPQSSRPRPCFGLLGGYTCRSRFLIFDQRFPVLDSRPCVLSLEQDGNDSFGYLYCVDDCSFMILTSVDLTEDFWVFRSIRNWPWCFDEFSYSFFSFPTLFLTHDNLTYFLWNLHLSSLEEWKRWREKIFGVSNICRFCI